MADQFDWNVEALAKLRKLWGDGLSTAAIARAMFTSKNAIVGRAHRLNLPPRPSPIRRGENAQPLGPRKRVGAKTSAENAKIVAAFFENPGVVIAEKPMVVTLAVRNPGPFKPCAFPIGDPKMSSFHFCGGAALVNRPYCENHARISYISIRDRREDAA